MQTTQWYIDVNEGMLVEAVELAWTSAVKGRTDEKNRCYELRLMIPLSHHSSLFALRLDRSFASSPRESRPMVPPVCMSVDICSSTQLAWSTKPFAV